MNPRIKTATSFAAVAAALALGGRAAAAPLKVYILVGQSNMEGQGAVRTFDYLGMDPKTAPLLKMMRNADGSPTVCKDVYISYLTGEGGWGKPMTPVEKQGPLTVGYGSLAGEPKIGPEFTFGLRIRQLVDGPILLIKTAWGGKSLNTDFRPPSAGPYELPEKIRELWAQHPEGAHGIPKAEDRPAWKAEKAKATGYYYRQMMDHVKKVLADPGSVVPGYDSAQGVELAGFVWFQGWNDMCDGQTYPEGDKSAEGFKQYSEWMADFIRDVRKELSAPAMPFVIGVIGVNGEKATGRLANLRPAMAAPADLPEFKGNVFVVQTGPFWDDALVAACEKQGKLNGMRDTADALDDEGRLDRDHPPLPGWQAVGQPAPEDRTWRYVSFDVQRASEQLDKSEGKRFRDVTLPPGLAGWAEPGFDDSAWKEGKAPIGAGAWKHRRTTVQNRSPWGKGEFLLMRTTFDLDAINCEAYRIAVLARQGFHVYLNGHKIHTYIWWKDRPYYRAIELGENETRYLKKGTNVLAAYANVNYDKKSGEPVGSVDLFLEGITPEGRAELERAADAVCSPAERAVAAGASNQGYHYMGSAKILGQIGVAFADALAPAGRGR